jgi:Zn-dependent protease with chaperone function
MPLLLVFCLMAACSPLDWPEPPFGIGETGSILAVCSVSIFLLMCAAIVSIHAVRGLKFRSRESVAHWYDRARTIFFFANLGSLWIELIYLGWGWAVQQFGSVIIYKEAFVDDLGRVVITGQALLLPGMEFVLLAPFFVTLIGSWFLFYDAERRFHQTRSDARRRGRFWSRLGYVSFQLRQQILFLLPLLFWIGLQAVLRGFPEWSNTAWMHYGMFLVMPLFLILCPLFIPTLLALKPLPPGLIRARLEASARRMGFRYTNLLHWETRGAMANAMVMGVVPFIRYVIFTDRLLEEMTPDEIDGVFGHEAGHARHGHLPFYAIFLLLSVALMGALYELAHSANWFVDPIWRDLLQLAPVLTTAIYIFVVFGFLSRRCERQADIYGCRAVSCSQPDCKGHDESTVLAPHGSGLCRTGIGIFIQALERVHAINGLDHSDPPWRGLGLRGKLNWIWHHLTSWVRTWVHSTIPKRVAFLKRIADDPAIERSFQRRIGLIKWGIILGLLGSLAGLVMWKGWGLLEAVV